MKTLFLVRHAKSSRVDPSLSDHGRPINDRGKRDAPTMGRRLAQREVRPDLLVTSPALRALTTAQLFADEFGVRHKNIVVDDRLYASSAERLLEVIHTLDGKFDCVMLFGHNPEFAELASRLARQVVEMRTCSVAEFSFETQVWSAVGAIEPAEFVLDSP
jgi:phosphohistidine phosphatase